MSRWQCGRHFRAHDPFQADWLASTAGLTSGWQEVSCSRPDGWERCRPHCHTDVWKLGHIGCFPGNAMQRRVSAGDDASCGRKRCIGCCLPTACFQKSLDANYGRCKPPQQASGMNVRYCRDQSSRISVTGSLVQSLAQAFLWEGPLFIGLIGLSIELPAKRCS